MSSWGEFYRQNAGRHCGGGVTKEGYPLLPLPSELAAVIRDWLEHEADRAWKDGECVQSAHLEHVSRRFQEESFYLGEAA